MATTLFDHIGQDHCPANGALQRARVTPQVSWTFTDQSRASEFASSVQRAAHGLQNGSTSSICLRAEIDSSRTLCV